MNIAGSHSLRLKATLFISTMLLLVGIVLSWYFLSRGEDILRGELEKRGLSLARNLAFNSRYGLLTEDPVILRRLIDGVLQEESVVYVAIASAQSGVLADEFRDDDEEAEGARQARALTILVGGVDISTLKTSELYELRRRFGMLFQNGALLTDLSVFENVAFPLREHTNLSQRLIRHIVLTKLHAVGLRGVSGFPLGAGMGSSVSTGTLMPARSKPCRRS